MKYLLVLLLLINCAYARLGENREELVARLGAVKLESKHFISAQGQMVPMGPALFFEKDQWQIQCDLIGIKCARITYNKKGEWTADQIATLLQNNAQGGRWTETKDSSKMVKKWNRKDAATAKWQFTGSMELVAPLYFEAKVQKEAELKARAEKKPDL